MSDCHAQCVTLESPAYVHILQTLKPRGINTCGRVISPLQGLAIYYFRPQGRERLPAPPISHRRVSIKVTGQNDRTNSGLTSELQRFLRDFSSTLKMADSINDRRGESVEDVASSSGTSDRDEEVSVRGRQTPNAFHQQAEAEESQSEGHKIRDWLCEIVNILDADEISLNRLCLKLQKEKSKDESVDDVASSSGTSDRDNPDAFHQQAEAEESQSEDQSKRELLHEIIKRVEADKISMSHTVKS
ncbi:uncharacterized protein LOC125260324 [Megalobrama amblycephala]|uniref:uncharacterized protein LOC125260324 n=1 Tax=Megalobrama amblycephala TaxID=75352 RepID=UPI00201450D3|nr:uncharacterized protein LOC125260324 [Megalobrama amblycephala]